KHVIVGPKQALLVKDFMIRDCNWLDAAGPGEVVMVKVRSTQPGHKARIERMDGGIAKVVLLEPQEAVSPGQACVAYDGDYVIGGGWITTGHPTP
ncbi:MAG: aminomethyltransferase beta-barrel domain-containing protein, partial [Alphaproteobacteria bacterium]